MTDILEGAQSGLEEFIASEATIPGTVTFSLWDFDTAIRCVHSFEAPCEVRGYQIVPRGATAMYDAIGMAVTTEGGKLADMAEDDRPEDVTVILASDGLENSSQEYSGDAVKKMLDHQQEVYGWRVIYMGCNQDALKEGAKIGVHGGLSVNSVASNAGQSNAWKMSASYLRRAPVTSAVTGQSVNFTDDERALGESE